MKYCFFVMLFLLPMKLDSQARDNDTLFLQAFEACEIKRCFLDSLVCLWLDRRYSLEEISQEKLLFALKVLNTNGYIILSKNFEYSNPIWDELIDVITLFGLEGISKKIRATPMRKGYFVEKYDFYFGWLLKSECSKYEIYE